MNVAQTVGRRGGSSWPRLGVHHNGANTISLFALLSDHVCRSRRKCLDTEKGKVFPLVVANVDDIATK